MPLTPINYIQAIRDHQAAKDHNSALEFAARGLRKYPDNGDIAVAAAKLYKSVKSYNIAFNLLSKVVQALIKTKRPISPSVLLDFGELAIRNNRLSDAKSVYERLLQSNYNQIAVITGLAWIAVKEEQLDFANEQILKALGIDPEFALLRFVQAQLFLAEKNDDAAIEVLEKNISHAQPHGESIDLWLSTLKKLNRERYAQDKLEELANQHPDVLEFNYGFGALAHRAGEYSLARKAFENSLKINPNNTRILHELAILERLAGNISRSVDYVERTLKHNPDNAPALRTHAMEHQFSYGDAAFSRLLKTAANYDSFSEADQIQLHYALAKAFDDAGDLDVAFRHYAVGGQKKQKIDPYNRRDAEKVGRMITQYITRKDIEATEDRGTHNETPVFILGMPRSGTSLLEQILASHPDVYGAGELKYLGGVIENMIIKKNAIHIGEKEPVFQKEQMVGWELRGERFIQQLRKLTGDNPKRIVDKMPGNYNYVGMIHALMPKAKIIHSQRHPIDTCLSCYKILFTEGQLWSYELTDLAHQYRKYWELMRHWRSEFPGLMFEVFYEQTVNDVEKQARALIDHLDLPWSDSCLSFHDNNRVVKTASAAQVRKPIYTTSAYRWKKYEKHIAALTEELGDIVLEYEMMMQSNNESVSSS
jgi:tetratricopeptide (TPR) repeat protein